LASFVASTLTSVVLSALGERDANATIDERVDSGSLLVAANFPSTTCLASAVAVVAIGVTYVPRRWRRAAWSWIAVLLVLRFLGPGQPPLDIWIAVSLGVVVGSVLLLTLGSPSVEP